jgi:geranylgeranyl diphosphate synthase type II
MSNIFHVIGNLEQSLHAAVALTQTKVSPPTLTSAIEYAVFPGGARVRPQLCLSVSHACGNDDPQLSMRVATAIELLHCASLAHDDLPCFDNAATRRGMPSLHARFGERIAILTGDALIILAFQYLAQSDTRYLDRLTLLIQTLTTSVGSPYGLIAGQAWESESDISLKQYHHAKTGALFVAASVAGAQAAGFDPTPWRVVGEHLGSAYQIADDIRDVIGNADDLGKPISQDQKHQRPNAVHSTQLTDAIDCFNTLITKTVESIPNCSHQQFLKELVLQQADRLIPKAAI